MVDKPRQANWFLHDGEREVGPLSEVQLRKRLAAAGREKRATLRVRQGESAWHPAEQVLSKFKELAASGIYLRAGERTDGPFTATRALELLRSQDVEQMQARIGREGAWVPAERLLRLMQRAERDGQRSAGQTRETRSTARRLESAPSAAIFEAAFAEEIVDAELVEAEIPTAVPVAASASGSAGGESFRQAAAVGGSRPAAMLGARPVARGNGRPVATSAASANGALSGSRSRKMIGVVGSVLSVMIALGLGGLRAYNRHQRRAEARQPTAQVAGAAMVDDAATDHEVLEQHGIPPVMRPGFLFRPTFETTLGVVDAGTAFAARASASSDPVMLSVLHLFGPAGGLDSDIPAERVPTVWTGLSVSDCVSGQAGRQLEGRPIPLIDARPLPASSSLGDVVAFQLDSAANLQPLQMTSALPRPGAAVWLLAEALNRRGLTHPAHVVRVEDGWLVYRFEDYDLSLQATSGAPVVDNAGRVVAINAGGGREGGANFGVGTPVSKFINRLAGELNR